MRSHRLSRHERWGAVAAVLCSCATTFANEGDGAATAASATLPALAVILWFVLTFGVLLVLVLWLMRRVARIESRFDGRQAASEEDTSQPRAGSKPTGEGDVATAPSGRSHGGAVTSGRPLTSQIHQTPLRRTRAAATRGATAASGNAQPAEEAADAAEKVRVDDADSEPEPLTDHKMLANWLAVASKRFEDADDTDVLKRAAELISESPGGGRAEHLIAALDLLDDACGQSDDGDDTIADCVHGLLAVLRQDEGLLETAREKQSVQELALGRDYIVRDARDVPELSGAVIRVHRRGFVLVDGSLVRPAEVDISI